MAISIVQAVAVARLLGPATYGILTLILAYTTTIGQFVDSRIWETAIKFVTQFRNSNELHRASAVVKLCYLTDLLTGAVAFLVLVLTAPLAAEYLCKSPETTYLLRIYAVTLLFSIPTGTATALLRLGDHFNWIAYHAVGIAMLKFLVVLAVLVMTPSLTAVVYAHIFVLFVDMLVKLGLGHIAATQLQLPSWLTASLRSLRGEFRSIFSFVLTTNGTALCKLFKQNADVLLIGFWLDSAAVGYFKVARSLGKLIAFPNTPLYHSSYPEFVQLWHEGNRQKLRRIIANLTLFSGLLAFASAAIIWFWGSSLLRLTAGEQYLPALPVLKLLIIGIAIAVTTNFGHPLLLAIGIPGASLCAIALGSCVQLAFLVTTLPQLGIVAAAWAYIAHYIVWTLVVLISLKSFAMRAAKPQQALA